MTVGRIQSAPAEQRTCRIPPRSVRFGSIQGFRQRPRPSERTARTAKTVVVVVVVVAALSEVQRQSLWSPSTTSTTLVAGSGLESIGCLRVPAGACRYSDTVTRDDGDKPVHVGSGTPDIAHSACNVPQVAAARQNAESSVESPGNATGKSWFRIIDRGIDDGWGLGFVLLVARVRLPAAGPC